MSPRCSERPTLQNMFLMYEAVCKVILAGPGLGPFWMWGGVYINMVYCMWCGQVPRPHALRELRYNPSRPPMSYVTLSTCVCKYLGDVSACTQIQILTHEHKLG